MKRKVDDISQDKKNKKHKPIQTYSPNSAVEFEGFPQFPDDFALPVNGGSSNSSNSNSPRSPLASLPSLSDRSLSDASTSSNSSRSPLSDRSSSSNGSPVSFRDLSLESKSSNSSDSPHSHQEARSLPGRNSGDFLSAADLMKKQERTCHNLITNMLQALPLKLLGSKVTGTLPHGKKEFQNVIATSHTYRKAKAGERFDIIYQDGLGEFVSAFRDIIKGVMPAKQTAAYNFLRNRDITKQIKKHIEIGQFNKSIVINVVARFLKSMLPTFTTSKSITLASLGWLKSRNHAGEDQGRKKQHAKKSSAKKAPAKEKTQLRINQYFPKKPAIPQDSIDSDDVVEIPAPAPLRRQANGIVPDVRLSVPASSDSSFDDSQSDKENGIPAFNLGSSSSSPRYRSPYAVAPSLSMGKPLVPPMRQPSLKQPIASMLNSSAFMAAINPPVNAQPLQLQPINYLMAGGQMTDFLSAKDAASMDLGNSR